MTNKEKLERVKNIETDQIDLMNSLKVLDNSIKVIDHESNEYATAMEIYRQHTAEMKSLISEKTLILLSLGFTPSDGMIDESIRETELWKQIDSKEAEADVYSSRQSICTNCPEFVTISGQCKVLGEFVSDYAVPEDSSCPIGNW